MEIAFELQQVHPDRALTELGRLTGLDPMETFYTDFPQPSTYPQRGVVGMHLLRFMPHGAIGARPVKPGCANALRLALACIKNYYR